MNLLEDNSNKKKKKTKAQKIVLSLLIFSIVLAVAIVIIMLVLKNVKPQNNYTIEINDNIVPKEKLGLLQLEDGRKYICIRAICDELGYKYFNGEYNTVGENKDKGYINSGSAIIQFYSNSNEIFKTEENGVKDFEYYKLKNSIIQYNNLLYISIEDLAVSFNFIEYYSKDKNKTIIQTPNNWLKKNKENFDTKGFNVSDTTDNLKAIAYGYVIVENDKKNGVVNLSLKEVIGSKYKSIQFVEYTGQFIVSNNYDKYGIINNNGTTEVEFQYDSIEVLNYNPLLYQVERQGKFGIMKKDGSIIGDIKYDSIGYPQDKEKNIYYTLIIPELNENIPQSIVVEKDNQYGLISLETSKEIIPCSLKGIFLLVKIEGNNIKKVYAVQFNNDSVNSLQYYVNYLNQITVSIN